MIYNIIINLVGMDKFIIFVFTNKKNSYLV